MIKLEGMERKSKNLKILYISPENTVGTLNLWKAEHERRGNNCRYVTFYPSAAAYPEDICLNLPLISPGSTYKKLRYRLQKRWYGRDPRSEKDGYPPMWQPENLPEKLWYRFRNLIWSFQVEAAIKKYALNDYDIYHFEWGLDFYRDAAFARRMKNAGKTIINTYHGQDMRNRGVIPEMDRIADLRLSSELDLLELHPKLKYLFLPFPTDYYSPGKRKLNSPVKVCHATTDRFFKGSEHIISVCRKLAAEKIMEFILIENMPHAEAMEVKKNCDINIDQLTDLGGWGYGMNSVESLSMGICTLAYLNDKYEKFIPDHPFVNTTPESLENNLRTLLEDPSQILIKGRQGLLWVRNNHDISRVADSLYEYYAQLGLAT